MQITKLEILGFGKFHNFSLDFSSKCNVIYGENEAGKSTLHSFIQAMLYGIPSAPSKKEEFFRYLPFSSECECALSYLYKDKHTPTLVCGK